MSCGWADGNGKEEDIKNVNQFIRLSVFFVYIRDRWDFFLWPHEAFTMLNTSARLKIDYELFTFKVNYNYCHCTLHVLEWIITNLITRRIDWASLSRCSRPQIIHRRLYVVHSAFDKNFFHLFDETIKHNFRLTSHLKSPSSQDTE